jgi:hypothetical protein
MTSKDKHIAMRDALLERILSRVQSIDRNVEDILDRVSDHFDDVRLDARWNEGNYGQAAPHEYHDAEE